MLENTLIQTEPLTLFPLGCVLLPGGVLPLRIFEARYNDMVRECMRNDLAFGVCRITKGNEVGVQAEYEPIGCAAKITDFDTEQPGILRIRAIGQKVFKVVSANVDQQGLVRAQVVYSEPEADAAVPAEYAFCQEALTQIIAQVDQAQEHFEKPYDFASAAWVSHRLTEVLPLSGESKQLLLQMQAPLERLKLLNQVLLQHSMASGLDQESEDTAPPGGSSRSH